MPWVSCQFSCQLKIAQALLLCGELSIPGPAVGEAVRECWTGAQGVLYLVVVLRPATDACREGLWWVSLLVLCMSAPQSWLSS